MNSCKKGAKEAELWYEGTWEAAVREGSEPKCLGEDAPREVELGYAMELELTKTEDDAKGRLTLDEPDLRKVPRGGRARTY